MSRPVWVMGAVVLGLTAGAAAFLATQQARQKLGTPGLRLEKEPPAQPEPILHAATEFARRVGIPMAPGNEELKAFCARNGLTPEYTRANRLLFGSLLVALACAYGVIKLGPIKG